MLGDLKEKPTPQIEAPIEQIDSDLNPIDEAYRMALTSLARLFFAQSSGDANEDSEVTGSLQPIVDGSTGPVFTKNADQTKIMLH